MKSKKKVQVAAIADKLHERQVTEIEAEEMSQFDSDVVNAKCRLGENVLLRARLEEEHSRLLQDCQQAVTRLDTRFKDLAGAYGLGPDTPGKWTYNVVKKKFIRLS